MNFSYVCFKAWLVTGYLGIGIFLTLKTLFLFQGGEHLVLFLLLTLLPIVGAKALWLALFVFVLLWGGIAKERGHENGSGEVGWWAALREWCIYLDESEFAALDAYTVGPRRGELGESGIVLQEDYISVACWKLNFIYLVI